MGKIKLFCIPHAGGSAMIYYKWNKLLRSNFDLYPVELAGRGKRINVPFYDSFQDAVDDIFYLIRHNLKDDYAIFGHSLGSWIALELVYKILEQGYKEPVHLFFSGNRAPHIFRKEKVLHTLPDEEFKKEIINIGGTPKELFENEELKELFLPVLRADYRILENYHFKKRNFKLSANITVINGIDDDLSDIEIEGWKEYTSGNFQVCNIKGGHFFINDQVGEVTKVVNNILGETEKPELVRAGV